MGIAIFLEFMSENVSLWIEKVILGKISLIEIIRLGLVNLSVLYSCIYLLVN